MVVPNSFHSVTRKYPFSNKFQDSKVQKRIRSLQNKMRNGGTHLVTMVVGV